jgi:glycosyltransferase involved in cell wall biosynthesis
MLTIITPCFNAERFIGACIEAVIQQGTDGVEHLIMDGGSRDQTVSIIKRYQERHPHIRLVSEKDRGQADAMNKGRRLATYRTIGFLNADDGYMPGTLARIKALLPGQPPLHFLVGNCLLRDINGRELCINRPAGMRFDRLLLLTRLYPFPSNPAAYFYDNGIHDVVGPYDESLHYTMDLEFLLRLARVAAIRHIDETWGIFVMHDDAKTADPVAGLVERQRWQARFIAELSTAQRWRYRLGKVATTTYEALWQLQRFAQRVISKALRLGGSHRTAA